MTKKRKRRKRIYIVLHHEIMYGPRADEMVFYIVSSMKEALKRIKTSGVARYSWWEIQTQLLDDPNRNWPDHVSYYGYRGRKLKIAPHDKCREIYKAAGDNTPWLAKIE